MEPHPGTEHRIAVMLPWTLVYSRCLFKYLEPYVDANVAGQEGHFVLSWGLDEEEEGDVDGGGVGGDSADRSFGLLVWLVGGADGKDDDGDGGDGAEVYFDSSMRLVGEVGDMNDGVGGGDGEDDDVEGIRMNPVGDIGEIGELDDAEGTLIKLVVVTVGDMGEESNSDGVVMDEMSVLAALSVWEEFV